MLGLCRVKGTVMRKELAEVSRKEQELRRVCRSEGVGVNASRRVCRRLGVGARDRVPAPIVRDQLDHPGERSSSSKRSPPQLYTLTLVLERSSRTPNHPTLSMFS